MENIDFFVTASRPWKSTGAVATVSVTINTYDSPKDIEKCLKCSSVTCWNCLAPRKQRGKGPHER